jgi:hypothetical protein
VEFYVPLGPRGFLLHFGTFLIGVVGGAVYRKDARRRGAFSTDPVLSTVLAELLAVE